MIPDAEYCGPATDAAPVIIIVTGLSGSGKSTALSVFEDRLSTAWNNHTNGELGGARITNWLGALLTHFQDDYSIAIVDIGPSLGALNRSVILACDYIVTPLGCDIFSLIGIENIAIINSLWYAFLPIFQPFLI